MALELFPDDPYQGGQAQPSTPLSSDLFPDDPYAVEEESISSDFGGAFKGGLNRTSVALMAIGNLMGLSLIHI